MSDCNGHNMILLLYLYLLFTPTIHHVTIKELRVKYHIMEIFLYHTRMTKHKNAAILIDFGTTCALRCQFCTTSRRYLRTKVTPDLHIVKMREIWGW